MHRLWLTSVTTPDRDVSKYCDFNFVFGTIISLYTVSNTTNKHCYYLLSFTLYLMPPISIATDCHNLIPKKNIKKTSPEIISEYTETY